MASLRHMLWLFILTILVQAFGNNMFGLPLLVNRPEVKEIADKLSKKTGSPVTGAQVL